MPTRLLGAGHPTQQSETRRARAAGATTAAAGPGAAGAVPAATIVTTGTTATATAAATATATATSSPPLPSSRGSADSGEDSSGAETAVVLGPPQQSRRRNQQDGELCSGTPPQQQPQPQQQQQQQQQPQQPSASAALAQPKQAAAASHDSITLPTLPTTTTITRTTSSTSSTPTATTTPTTVTTTTGISATRDRPPSALPPLPQQQQQQQRQQQSSRLRASSSPAASASALASSSSATVLVPAAPAAVAAEGTAPSSHLASSSAPAAHLPASASASASASSASPSQSPRASPALSRRAFLLPSQLHRTAPNQAVVATAPRVSSLRRGSLSTGTSSSPSSSASASAVPQPGSPSASSPVGTGQQHAPVAFQNRSRSSTIATATTHDSQSHSRPVSRISTRSPSKAPALPLPALPMVDSQYHDAHQRQDQSYHRTRADSLTVDSTTSSGAGPPQQQPLSLYPARFPPPFGNLSPRPPAGPSGYSSPHPSSGVGTGIGVDRDHPANNEAQPGSQVSETDGGPRPPPLNTSSAPVVTPIIKVKPEYQTIYRKDPSGVQGKQNVVCVISIELPSRRPRQENDGRPPPFSQSRLNAATDSNSPPDPSAPYHTRTRDPIDSRSLEEERSASDDRELTEALHDLRSRPMYRTATGTAASLAGSSTGLPVPHSPSLHTRTNSASNDDRHAGLTGPAGSESGYKSNYTRSDEKLAGARESVPTLGSSPEDAGFSFGATPAAASASTSGDMLLYAATEDLRLRVIDWKGHGPSEFGPLLTFGFLSVRQTSVIREFHVFLFREVLLCINEEKKKGLSRFISVGSSHTPSGPATGAPVTEQTIQNLASNAQHAPALKLKGRIYLRHIRKIACSPPKVENTINIKLDDDSLDQFVLVFNTREEMDAWAKHILGQLSANALARSTVYGLSAVGMRTASEPGRPTPGLGIEVASGTHSVVGTGQSSFVASSSDTGTMLSGSSSVPFSPMSKSSRRAESISKRPQIPPSPHPLLPSPMPATPSTHYTASPVSPATTNRRARSRSPSAYSRSSAFASASERFPSRARSASGSAGPITTVAVDDAPYAKWSSSGGFNPSLPAPPLLPHSPIDLVVIISVPPPTRGGAGASHSSMSTASLKLRVIRATLELVISSMGPRDRLAVVTFSIGQEGQVRRTALLNSHKPRSVQKFQQFVHSLDHGWDPKEDDPFLEDITRGGVGNSSNGTASPHIDSAAAINIGIDIMLQRKSKNPVSGMLLISDNNDTPRRTEMDFILARAEAANVPIHSFGFGKSHDAQTLWQLSNHTRGLYSFVREWDQLQECLLGCIGSLMSVALVDFKAHIGVPSDNHFRVRKISGPTGAVISANGKDVTIDVGELHYGDVKEVFVELEFDFNGLIPFVTETNADGRMIVRGVPSSTVEGGSATDELLHRFGLQGLSLNDQSVHEMSATPMIEDIAVLEVDASYRDTTSSRTPFETPQPTILTLEVDATSPDPLSEASPGTVAVLADPNVTRRRIEILVSEMISRSLYLASRQNDRQALAVLSETRRIVEIVVQAMSGQDRQALPTSQRRVRKPREFASMSTIDTFYGILEDLDLLLDGLEHARHHFDRDLRNYAAQQAMILRDQKAWTTRTLLEYMHFQDDNGPALTAHGAILGRTSVRQ